jgi:hypothetical protein
MQTRTTRFSGAVAAVLLAAAPAAALLPPVDDCEVGTFSLQTNQGTEVQTSVPIPGTPSHAISGERVVRLAASNQPGPYTTASLSPGPGDDYLSIDVADAGYCDVEYTWGAPMDLTFGGAAQWIEMDVFAPHASDQITMTISDGTGQTGFTQGFQFGGRETVVWGLGNLSPSVLAQATSITFHFHPGQSGTSFLVYDVRFRAIGSGAVTFAGTSVAVQTPPVPSAPLSFTPFDASTGNPLYDANVAIADATTDAMTVPSADWTWAKTTGLGGEWAEMSFLWTEPGGVQQTDFEIRVDLSQVDGGYVPDLYPPDPIHDAKSILLHFPAALRSTAGGAVQAVSDTWLGVDVVEGQGLDLQNVAVTGNPVTRSWTDGFTLSFRMQFASAGTTDVQTPLFTATWISDFGTQVTTGVAPPGDAGAEALRLTAVPSVTTGGTEIRAVRPLDRAAELVVHDVAGRTVRRLPMAVGTRAVRWSGRDAGGMPVAAGVYFVRLTGFPDAVTRVVRLR